jgi:SSS family solute:Na+ symporter
MIFGYISSPINAGAIAMVAGLVIVPLVSLLTPKMKKEKVDSVFVCYEETVTVRKKKSIQE